MELKDRENMVREYKELYKRKFGIELSNQEALAKATLLVEFWRIIRRPIPKKKQTND